MAGTGNIKLVKLAEAVKEKLSRAREAGVMAITSNIIKSAGYAEVHDLGSMSRW